MKNNYKQMKIRNKILIYFSSSVIALTAIALTILYVLFSEYREEEFQQRQKEKIKYTIRIIPEFKEKSEELAGLMDELDIHDFYDEKMMVYDNDKQLIFSSIDDLPINISNEILAKLSPTSRWVETREENYDVVGVYTDYEGEGYYAVSKAYDTFGYTKVVFLRNVLIGIFISISLIVIFLALYLSNKISKPITELTENLNRFDLGNEQAAALEIEVSSYELRNLTIRFNELLKRTNEAFTFQKHIVNHISHELKTPIAVLVSELEKLHNYPDIHQIKSEISMQVDRAKSLGNIINVLLEISRIESGQAIRRQKVRVDEMLFDTIATLNDIYPDFHFEVNYSPDSVDEKKLILNVNEMLLSQAFYNLLSNCITYSSDARAEIRLDGSLQDELLIAISNKGPQVTEEEEKYLFYHFFRGKNSFGKAGFGLGLVLTKKIINQNSGTIVYSNSSKDLNVFEIRFPLSGF